MAEQPNLRDIIKQEIKKCVVDPVYFMKKYVKIQHPHRGTIPFDLYTFQESTLQNFAEDRFTLILKSRQMGITTLVAAYSLWLMIFNSDKNILIISIKQEVSKEIITKVRFANDHLPSWLKVPATTDNLLSLRLRNGSQIKATSSSKDAGRSMALSLLVLDEAAFIDDIEDIWTSAFNTLSTGGRAIVLSTPNGVGNWFHQKWVEAERKKNDFKTIVLLWSLHPDRNQLWRDEQDKQLGMKKATQECFSGNVIVYTKSGPKKISEISVGDNVLTHNGKYKPVTHTFRKLSKAYKISSNNNFLEKFVTKNHPFLTDDGWKEVGKLKKDDYIFTFPINIDIFQQTKTTLDLYSIVNPKYFSKILCDDDQRFYINDRKHKTIHNRYISVDYKFGYLIGLYLAEGSGCRLRKVFNFNYEKEINGWPKTLKEIVKDLFKFSNNQIRNLGNTGHLSFCSEIFSSVIDCFVRGDDCYNKQLTSFAYDVMNKEFAKGIIDGVFRGGGCLKKEYYKTISTTSQNLIYDVSYLLNLLSITDFSIRHMVGGNEGVIDNRKFICSDKWEIKIRKTKNVEVKELSDILTLSNLNISNINLNNVCIDVEVFNLGVEDDHSYITEYGIVHNCDCNFLTSGASLIDLMTLKWYEENQVKNPIEMRMGNTLWIFSPPDYTKDYIVCADVARGDGSDFSAAHVFDAETMEQVAEYQDQVGTKEYGNILVSLATEYNDALLIVERENIGWAVLQEIINREYKNTFYSSSDLKIVDVHRQLKNKYLSEDRKMVPGFSTNVGTRPLIINTIEKYFREKTPTIHSIRVINELKTFIWERGKPQAAPGYFDDLVMSLGLGLWVRDTALKLRQEGIFLTKSMLDKIRVPKAPDGPAPIYSSTGAHSVGRDYWKMKVGANKIEPSEDLTWLL